MQSYVSTLPQDQIASQRDKQNLVNRISLLEAKDHVGIARLVIEATDRKIYTVNNRGFFFDLNVLDKDVLNKISHHVTLCIDNQKRDHMKKMAEKEYNDNKEHFEERLRTNSKLKLPKRVVASPLPSIAEPPQPQDEMETKLIPREQVAEDFSLNHDTDDEISE